MLLRGLYNEPDPINFLALLAEVRTGLFLDPLCSELRYNAPSIENSPTGPVR